MKKDDTVYLEHILIHISKLEKYSFDKEYSDFIKDEAFQNNIIRLLEIISEASIKISNELKEKYPEVSWAKIKGMRNILVHDYMSVRLDVVWNTIKLAIPIFKKQIEKIIEDLTPQSTLDF